MIEYPERILPVTRLEKAMKRAFSDVLKIKLDRKVSMRLAAHLLNEGRVAQANRIRGLYL
jgi:glutamate dehydrogenase/leucine dehydrogenase